ncbi:NADH dehydrogenase subunit 5 [Iris pallida]|uniref:NADH dehydrogenase subunit 5 (Plastid) n=1 Tax=Iris pallida TaxID=29817 RepID=A0AAX6DP32_IRIPA|nr:NADH dehydrogenase subunit 5 [Iris pallida]
MFHKKQIFIFFFLIIISDHQFLSLSKRTIINQQNIYI